MLRRTLTVLLVTGFALAALVSLNSSNAATAAQQNQIEVAVLWSGGELAAFNKVVAAFEAANPDIDVQVNSVGRDLPTILVSRCEAGNPPDVAAIPNPGQMKEFVEAGCGGRTPGLAALDRSIVKNHPQAFVNLGQVGGTLYGVFISADLKSLVWYNPQALAAEGFSPSALAGSWNNLMGATSELAANGKTAWCIGLESGAASGWPGTDWIEDIMLRTAGPEVYDQWVAHDIPWTDARVKAAFELFGQVARNPDFVLGGPQGALATPFGESPNALFTDPPGCYFHRQATFIQSFITDANPDLTPVQDFNIFLFPPIEPAVKADVGNPLLGAGDLVSVFKDSSAAQAFIAFLASAEAQEIWASELKKLPINTQVDLSVLENPIAERAGELLRGAKAFRFDGSDLMPAAVGSGAFWSNILSYVSGADLCTVLKNLEVAAENAYTSGAATNGQIEAGACP